MQIRQKGFTLVEMLVVVAIIGILSAFALISYDNHQEKVMRSLAKSSIDRISQQMQTYYLKTKIKVLTIKEYEAFENNTVEPFQSPENDHNYSKHFKKPKAEIVDNYLYIIAEPQDASKYKVGAYYKPANKVNNKNDKDVLTDCKTNNQAFSPTNWTCK